MSYYVLLGRGKLHSNVAVSYVRLQCNACKHNSPVDESSVAMTLHVTWCSVPSNSPAAPKSTFMHSCHQHTFERFLFMLMTLHVLCVRPSALTQRDVTAEVEGGLLSWPFQCIGVYVALLQPWKS